MGLRDGRDHAGIVDEPHAGMPGAQIRQELARPGDGASVCQVKVKMRVVRAAGGARLGKLGRSAARHGHQVYAAGR